MEYIKIQNCVVSVLDKSQFLGIIKEYFDSKGWVIEGNRIIGLSSWEVITLELFVYPYDKLKYKVNDYIDFEPTFAIELYKLDGDNFTWWNEYDEFLNKIGPSILPMVARKKRPILDNSILEVEENDEELSKYVSKQEMEMLVNGNLESRQMFLKYICSHFDLTREYIDIKKIIQVTNDSDVKSFLYISLILKKYAAWKDSNHILQPIEQQLLNYGITNPFNIAEKDIIRKILRKILNK